MADIDSLTWHELLSVCGVARRDVDQVVECLMSARKGIFLWAMGLTHHAHGVDNIHALSNLMTLRSEG